jgi:hypothetical protein
MELVTSHESWGKMRSDGDTGPGLSIRGVDDEESLRRWTRLGSQPVAQQIAARDCFHPAFANPGFGQPSRWRFFLAGVQVRLGAPLEVRSLGRRAAVGPAH